MAASFIDAGGGFCGCIGCSPGGFARELLEVERAALTSLSIQDKRNSALRQSSRFYFAFVVTAARGAKGIAHGRHETQMSVENICSHKILDQLFRRDPDGPVAHGIVSRQIHIEGLRSDELRQHDKARLSVDSYPEGGGAHNPR